MNKKPIILCDVDDVLADFVGAWAKRISAAHGISLCAADFVTWDLHGFLPHDIALAAYRDLGDPNFYDEVSVLPGALEGIERLRELGRVVFVTSSNTAHYRGKAHWMETHGFLPDQPRHSDLIMAHDKSLIRGDLLIDDGAHNITAFPGETLLFDHPHNRALAHPLRCSGWPEVVGYAEELHSLGLLGG